MDTPLVYLSAPRRQRGNPWLERFQESLQLQVAAGAGVPDRTPLVFLSTADRVPEGAEKQREQALAESRVLVPLFSPAYFEDVRCGREWWYVAGRREGAARIVPVLWEPVPTVLLPPAVHALRTEQPPPGGRYARHGLSALVRTGAWGQEYCEVVAAVARRLVEIGRNAARSFDGAAEPGALAPPDLTAGPSAFPAAPGVLPGAEVRVLYLAAPELECGAEPEALPYGALGRPWEVAERVARQARERGLRPLVEQFDPAAEGLPAGRPTVLVVDPRALLNGSRGTALHRALAALADSAISALAVVVPWEQSAEPQSRRVRRHPEDVQLARAVDVLEPWWGRFRREWGPPLYVVADEDALERQLSRELRRVASPPGPEQASLSTRYTRLGRLLGPLTAVDLRKEAEGTAEDSP
jgi:hypothetical protein